MNTLHVEYLMNHKLGLTQSYMKPTKEALFNDYLKAVPSLTIPSGSHTGQIYLSFLREYVLLLSHFAHTANTS